MFKPELPCLPGGWLTGAQGPADAHMFSFFPVGFKVGIDFTTGNMFFLVVVFSGVFTKWKLTLQQGAACN